VSPRHFSHRPWVTQALLVALAVTAVLALAAGRLAIPPLKVAGILLSPWLEGGGGWSDMEARVVNAVRLPRVCLAALIGAGLSAASAALQSLFRNPLAEPQLLGVSSGAAFGGVLALLLVGDGWPLIGGALTMGLAALALVFWLAGGKAGQGGGTILLILAGIVVSAVFAAGVSLVKLVADPQNQLPAIVFWLMGSLSSASWDQLKLVVPAVGLSLLLLHALRFQFLALTIGDEDARLLGIQVARVRSLALLAVGVITAASVAVCGVIGWVGLVVPHLVRMGLGTDHRAFLPNTMLAGAIYLILVDTLARTVAEVEIPVGVLTALLGAPIFAFLLRRVGRSL